MKLRRVQCSALMISLLAGSAQAGLTDPFPAVFELSSLLPTSGGDGSLGFVLEGVDTFDYSGRSVSSAGDVNGDGVDDLIVGALYADPGGRFGAGESYVVFGRSVPPPPCAGDADGDRMISFPDITAILRNWNVSYVPGTGPGDADGNGVVGFPDLTATQSNWGMPFPN